MLHNPSSHIKYSCSEDVYIFYWKTRQKYKWRQWFLQWCTCSFASQEGLWNSWVALAAWLDLMCPVSRRNDRRFKIGTSGLLTTKKRNVLDHVDWHLKVSGCILLFDVCVRYCLKNGLEVGKIAACLWSDQSFRARTYGAIPARSLLLPLRRAVFWSLCVIIII